MQFSFGSTQIKVEREMMQLNFILVHFVFIIIISIECGILSTCNKKDFCGACIQEPGCLWCSKPRSINNETPIYCNDVMNASATWCEATFLVKEDTVLTIIKDSPLSQIDNNIVQIRPQKIKLQIRKGVEFKINFQYQQVINYPIDLYFLMDLSASMEPYRKDLGLLGGQLAEKMKKLTSNFRLGFGSFVDKRDLPFINTSPSLLKNPCGNKKACEPAYSFKNHLSLTSEAELFTNQVKMAKKSGNVDAPEGGFDALMQAMVCSDTIGWRTEARRLIIFATDADFHIAGDGKLGGVIEPNDAKCHMINNEYTDDLIYDYPSVSHINYIANVNNFNIIFAIVVEDKRIYEVYETLSRHIDNSAIGRFGMNTAQNNIVNLITENYNKIVDKITITDNSTTDIHITYNPDCTSANGGDRNICNNFQLGQVINFTATIRANNCWNTTQSFTIKPGGLHANLNVLLDVVCQCDCEMRNHKQYESNALDCNGHGNKECGVCRCHEGQYGDKCQCSSYGDDGDSDESHCFINDLICSGQGECICGQCVCRGKNYGKYCQCDDTICVWYDGELCSGHGRCDCGNCNCNAGWHGSACHLCVERNSTCVAPGDTNDGDDARLCSGRGECKCGQCKCDASKHTGEWCEETLGTPEERCQNLQTCLDCREKSSETECEASCTNLILNSVPTTIIKTDGNDQDVQVCRYSSDYCTKVFTYVYISKNTYNVTGVEEIDCSDPAVIVGYLLLYVVGSILLAGIIALIIWKVCTTVMDRREYAKFENEQKKSKWHTDENPLFINPINTFANPTYNRRSIWKK